jgi:hypothetical protein
VSASSRRLELVIGAAVAVVAAAVAASGPGWFAAAEHVTAARLGNVPAWSPGYAAVAALAAWLPIGEVAARVALISALAAGLAAAGVVAMTRALVPREVGAGVAAVIVLAAVGAVRTAAAVPGPAMLVAAGVAWTAAGVIAIRRGEPGEPAAVGGLALALATAPWLGVALAVIVVPVVWPRRRALLVVPLAVVAPLILVAGVPPSGVALAAARARAVIGALGGDAGVVVLGAGALGLGFGAATGLRGAGIAVLVVLAALIGAIASPIGGPDGAVVVLIGLALGIPVLATAGLRAAAGTLDGARRSIAAGALAAAFVLPAVLLARAAEVDAGDAPARVAADLAGTAPAGPGAVFVGGEAALTALRHERVVAGLRPDLVPAPRTDAADQLVVALMRQGQVVVADLPAFGRLDDRFARPTGRGFQLLLAEPAEAASPPRPPASYAGAIGAELAARLALARALWEGAAGRLDDAARAAGLAGTRFDAGTIAVLGATRPTAARPALFAFVPDLGSPDGADRLALFGDDLAWVGAIPQPPLPPEAAPERRLHARWQAILVGIAPPADPAIAALGDAAVTATRAMLKATGRDDAADKLAPR